MGDHCGTVTPVVSLPHDKVMVFESNPEPIAARTGGSAASPMPALEPATFSTLYVLAAGGTLEIIIPAVDYESTFVDAEDLRNYEELVADAARVETCPFTDPSESAFLYAGRRVVDRCDTLIAIWEAQRHRLVREVDRT